MDIFKIEDLDVPQDINFDDILSKLIKNITYNQKKVFPNSKFKQEIVVLNNNHKPKIKIACPFCGDSKHNEKEKRGNIHLDTMTYKCWNGGCPSSWMTMDKFLEKIGCKDDFSSYELDFIKNNSKRFNYSVVGSSKKEFNPVIKKRQIEEYGIPVDIIKEYLRLKDIHYNEYVYNYLKSRNQIKQDNRHFLCNTSNNDVYVLNLTSCRTKVIGIQIRHSNIKVTGRRFTTYNYSDIWLKILNKNISDEVKEKMDKLSMIYNILQVDFSLPIFVLEGSMDANHLKNSIATWSASNRIYLPNGYYIFDNTLIDNAGYKATVEMLNKNHYVFLWKKFFEEEDLNYKDFKDIDDIFKKRHYRSEDLLKYFSNNQLDIFYV